ncbi:hypothetical protein SDC9_02836 [bioreactor metagenome]|uniref:Uncharacterized protein n=1 Tax=bioreactor metagenome TaxID=1076179 RepID=A0A644SRU3_9ZZZZ|nr:DUF4851 domain-containing protein [Desulfovibrio desulfuricans]MEA4989802.1 DUF4851 domain-containing protein [Desulfovibrio desulfuricans]
MKTVLYIGALLLCGFHLLKYAIGQPSLRGMGQKGTAEMPVLVSRARPVVTFAPAKDMSLTAAGWCSLSPETRLSVPGNGRLWFAAYNNGAGLLISALAKTEAPWLWEAAHHLPFPVLRGGTTPYKGETLHETLYTLSADADPFHPLHDAAKDAPCLVYRAKLLLDFQQIQVIIEYHEPITQEQARDMAYDLPYLNAFQERGRAACSIVLPGKSNGDVLPRRIDKISVADKAISRIKLSRWTGEMQRRGSL